MAHIVLTEEQAAALSATGDPVELHDPSGRLLAVAHPFSPLELEALERYRRRKASPSSEPTIPSEQVQAHFRQLEEIRLREGEMDRERMFDLLRRMRAGEEV